MNELCDKARNRALAFLAHLVVALAVLMPLPAWAGTVGAPDHLELQALLRNGDLKQLESIYSNLQEQFEKGDITDYRVAHAYYALTTTAPDLAERLDEWVSASPNSHVPLVARGRQRLHLAWIARGGWYGNETSPDSFEEMNRLLELAVADASKALELNPRVTTAHYVLMSAAQLKGARILRKNIVDLALRQVPHSLFLRSSYMNSLVPWWGGSVQEVEAFIRESKPYLPTDGGIHELHGFADFTRARMLVKRGKRREARAYFDRALMYGDMSSYRLERGMNLFYLRSEDLGLSDIDRVLSRSPYYRAALIAKAKVLAHLDRTKEAFELWDLVLALDPLNPGYLKGRAKAFSELWQFNSAIEDLDKAIQLGGLNHAIRNQRGLINLQRLGNREAARKDFEVAITVAPKRADYWYYYAESLTEGPNSEAPECRAVQAFWNFLLLCKAKNTCDANNVVVAEYFTTQRPLIYGAC